MSKKIVNVSCIMLVIVGISFLLVNAMLYKFADNFAEEHDLIYTTSKTPLSDLTIDGDELSGITHTYGNVAYFVFTTIDGKEPKIDDHIMEEFKLKIINIVDTFLYVRGMVIFIGLFLTAHLYKYNRSKFGSIMTFLVGVFVIFYGILDGLQFIICFLLILSAILVYRNKEILHGRGLPFWHYL